MTGWHEGRLLAWDTESSGVDVENDRIVTAAVLRCGGGQDVEIRRWLIAVDVEIPEAAQQIHGVSTEQARADGIPAKAALEGILDELERGIADGLPLIGFNTAFDWTLLDRNCRHFLGEGLPFDPRPCVDGLVIDRACDTYRKGSRKLQALCDHYSVKLDEAHAAHGDALAAARLAWRLACVYADECADVEALHDKQVGWHQAWSGHFADYLRKQGKPADDVDGSWPLRPWVDEAAVA